MHDPIKVVLFDLGRVLMHIDFDAFPNNLGLFTDEEKNRYDQTAIRHTVRKYETGEMTTDQFFNTLHALFLNHYSVEKIRAAFDSIIQKDNAEILPFVEQMHSRYRIAVLSNTCASHWEHVIRLSSVIKLFPDIFTSFRLGAMKPEPIVYEKVISTLSVQPSEIVFIDDLKENVDGARAAGMHGIIFKNTPQLQSDFFDLTAKQTLKVKY